MPVCAGPRICLLALVFAFCGIAGRAHADGCTSDADCKAGRVCFEGACREPAPACATDRDCPGDQLCESGRCVAAPPAPSPALSQPAPPPAPLQPAGPFGPPDIAPAGSRPPSPSPSRSSDDAGNELSYQAFLAGGFQDRDDASSGIGWAAGAGVGVRFDSGVALLAIGGYAAGSTERTNAAGTTGSLPIRLSYAGAAVGFHSRTGLTTLGLAYARSPSTLGPVDEGMAFVLRGFYHLVGGFSLVLETTMAVVGDGRASTLSLGVGYAQ